MISGPLRRFLKGSGFFLAGFSYLQSHRRLWGWVILPLIIDFVLLFAGWFWSGQQVTIWAHQAAAAMLGHGTWSTIFYYPLWAIIFLVAFILWLYLVFLLSSILVAPFNSLLVRGVFKSLSVKTIKTSSFAEKIRWLFELLLKVLFLAILGIMIFFMSFIPGLNLLAILLALLAMCFDCVDYAFEVLDFSLKERKNFFFQHFFEFFGMACSLSLTLWVPGLTILVLPFGVIGTALFVADSRLLGQSVTHV